MNSSLEFYGYLVGSFADADLLGQTDEQAAVARITVRKRVAYEKVLAQGRAILALPMLDWERIAGSANRDFKNEDETRAWLTRMMDLLDAALQKV